MQWGGFIECNSPKKKIGDGWAFAGLARYAVISGLLLISNSTRLELSLRLDTRGDRYSYLLLSSYIFSSYIRVISYVYVRVGNHAYNLKHSVKIQLQDVFSRAGQRTRLAFYLAGSGIIVMSMIRTEGNWLDPEVPQINQRLRCSCTLLEGRLRLRTPGLGLHSSLQVWSLTSVVSWSRIVI